MADKEEEILQMLEDEGVTVTEPDRAAFKEATSDVKNTVEEVPQDLSKKLKTISNRIAREGILSPGHSTLK